MTQEVEKQECVIPLPAGKDFSVGPPRAQVIAAPLGLLTRQLVAEAKEQIGLLRDMKRVLCTITPPECWTSFGKKPYLQDAGIEMVAAAIGFLFGKPEIECETREDAKGIVIYYHCHLGAVWQGKTYWDIGTASSRDAFFAQSHGEEIPLEEIDLGDIRKKAHTNAKHRVFVSALGLDGITWDDLKAVGIEPGPGGTVRFKGQERKTATGAGDWNKAKERLLGLILELAQGDEEAASRALFELTNNPGKGYKGVTDPKQLTERQVAYLLPQVERRLAERDAQMGPPPQEETRAPGQEG